MSAKTNKRREETSCAHFNKTWMLGKYATCTLVFLMIFYNITGICNFLNFVNTFISVYQFMYVALLITSNALTVNFK